jgi:Serine/threonine protein kinase
MGEPLVDAGRIESLHDAAPTLRDPPRITGRFRVERLLAVGGMGEVYSGHRTSDGLEVALKILRPELLLSPEAVARFDREAKNASALRGKHAVRILEVGRTDGGQPFIAMERLHGVDLAQVVAERGALDGVPSSNS